MCRETSKKYLLLVGTENAMVMPKTAGISTFAVALQKMSTMPSFFDEDAATQRSY